MRLSQQHWSGLFFVAFGAFVLWAGKDLAIGTAGDMGIGYTPRALAIGCVAVGCILLGTTFFGAAHMPMVEGEGRIAIAWWPLVLVTGMVIAFDVLLPLLGLPLTVVLMTFMAALSGEDFQLPLLIVIAAGMALLSTLLFSTALNLQIPVWPF